MRYTKNSASLKVPIEIAIDKFCYVLGALPAQQHTVILSAIAQQTFKMLSQKPAKTEVAI